MKFLLLAALAFTVSCGKIENVGGSGGIGGTRELQVSTIGASDGITFDRICQALTRKAEKLGTSLPNALQFDVIEKDCNGSTATFGTQQVRVEGSSGSFTFRRQDTNGLFVFPNVETPDSGIMDDVCGASQMPIVSGNSARWVSTSGFTSSDCPSSGNEICLVVEHGLKEQNTQNTYRIHTREFIRFNVTTTSGKYGYFTHRKAYASNNCDQGDFTETTVSLR